MYTFMHSIIVSLMFSILAPSVAAVGYKGYSSTTQCSGDNFFCDDGGDVCCQMPAAYGFSAVWDNLPASSQGQAYRNSVCTEFIIAVFGSGTKCWNGGGENKAATLDWFFSHPIGRRRLASAECTTPDGFGYYDAEGNYREIKVPQGGMNVSERIAEIYGNRDYAALATYETY